MTVDSSFSIVVLRRLPIDLTTVFDKHLLLDSMESVEYTYTIPNVRADTHSHRDTQRETKSSLLYEMLARVSAVWG